MSLETLTETYLPALEDEMRAIVPSPQGRHGELFGMLRYHLGWVDARFQPCDARSGKRVRPLLCLLACQGCGGSWQRALPAAAAIELLHNFTLIHDDIEDQDDRRRGRRTVWSLWGEAQGINAGDTLFALSQLALLRLRERSVSPTVVACAAHLFNETCVSLTGGQYLDIGFESRDEVSVKDYLAMIEGKTAALVGCSCAMGALVAGAPNTQREHLRSFGRHSGLAFQMLDDILGIWGDPNVTGKPVGADLARRKKTLPLLHGLERSSELRSLMARERLSAGDCQRATELLEEAGSRDYADGLARHHHDEALGALERAELAGSAGQALRELANRLLSRER
ncbi:MAG: polyprenyl synthetase family protein [Anaerolineae bacterium]|jgi:geranylgeranyl diphosphate synthase type I